MEKIITIKHYEIKVTDVVCIVEENLYGKYINPRTITKHAVSFGEWLKGEIALGAIVIGNDDKTNRLIEAIKTEIDSSRYVRNMLETQFMDF